MQSTAARSAIVTISRTFEFAFTVDAVSDAIFIFLSFTLQPDVLSGIHQFRLVNPHGEVLKTVPIMYVRCLNVNRKNIKVDNEDDKVTDTK